MAVKRLNRMTLTVTEAQDGQRIDKMLSEALVGHTRSAIQRFLNDGAVLVNRKPAAKNLKVSAGDRIEIEIPEPEPSTALPEDIPLDVVYEDEHLLVVNKPKGMVVHPAAGHTHGTLVNALLFHCGDSLSGIGGVLRPGIVHRLDKDTSGLLIVAKNDRAHDHLARQIAEHSFTREYEAVVHGRMKEDSGTINAPIGRHPNDRKKMAVLSKGGREAVTHYTVIERFSQFTHVRLKLETGRTHQIRVHLAQMGRPVAGDPVYGPKKVIKELFGQCLHAKAIGFVHPATGEFLSFDSELPDCFKEFLAKLGTCSHRREMSE